MPKRDLVFSKPIMNAAGTLGFAPDAHAPLAWSELGAFVTNPISLRPRRAASAPAVAEFPGGFILHSGLPNPGFHSALKRYARRWQESATPVIVNLMADRPEQTREMVRALEGLDNILAVELGFAPLLAPDIIAAAVELCRSELPLVVSLPSEHLLGLGGRLLELGASAISLAAPRGAVRKDGQFVTGRMYGPALFPRSLELVLSAVRLGLPVLGGGGVCTQEDVDAMLGAGALAVQLDARLWLPRHILAAA